jgi:HEAT repeat protein
MKVVPARQAEAAQGLENLLNDPDQRTLDAAVQGLSVWATKANAPAVARVLDDTNPFRRWKALKILARLKDDKSAEAIARCLTQRQDRTEAARALVALGPGAEKAVIPFLGNQDPLVRREALRVLAQVGTPASIPAIKQLGTLDRTLTRDAAAAVQLINARK